MESKRGAGVCGGEEGGVREVWGLACGGWGVGRFIGIREMRGGAQVEAGEDEDADSRNEEELLSEDGELRQTLHVRTLVFPQVEKVNFEILVEARYAGKYNEGNNYE